MRSGECTLYQCNQRAQARSCHIHPVYESIAPTVCEHSVPYLPTARHVVNQSCVGQLGMAAVNHEMLATTTAETAGG